MDHSLLLDITGSVWALGSNHYGQLGIGGGGPEVLPDSSSCDAVASPQCVLGPSSSSALSKGTSSDASPVDKARMHSPPGWERREGRASVLLIQAPFFQILCLYPSLWMAERAAVCLLSMRLLPGQVGCGALHSLAVTDEGLLLSWGWGGTGSLGHGSIADVSVPAVVEALRGLPVVQAAGGAAHSLVLSGEAAWAGVCSATCLLL